MKEVVVVDLQGRAYPLENALKEEMNTKAVMLFLDVLADFTQVVNKHDRNIFENSCGFDPHNYNGDDMINFLSIPMHVFHESFSFFIVIWIYLTIKKCFKNPIILQ